MSWTHALLLLAGTTSTGQSEASQPVRPRGPIERWISSAPFAGIEHLPEGEVRYRLQVGPDGRPTACDIVETSGSRLLDQEVCKLLMRRARFHPATNAQGEPVAGQWSGSFKVLEPADPGPAQPS